MASRDQTPAGRGGIRRIELAQNRKDSNDATSAPVETLLPPGFMGLDTLGTRFVLYAKSAGVDFSQTAMIGRQELQLTAHSLRSILSSFNYSLSWDQVNHLLDKRGASGRIAYAEPFLELLGATDISSFDASPYEDATDVFDFNQPIGDQFKGKFTVVIDGGTLEHVFNLPQALKNCMEMVEVGGHFIGLSPTNNWPGHGFYQFSHELFYRVFSKENGFEAIKVVLVECTRSPRWYEVIDPDAVRSRVEFSTRSRAYLFVLAKRVEDRPVFSSYPNQSDYVTAWSTYGQRHRASASVIRALKILVPASLHPTLNRVYARGMALYRGVRPYDPKYFRRVSFP